MKIGSKYYPLFERLQSCDAPQITLSWDEIERLIERPLPTSASDRAWWSNRDSASAIQSKAWIQAGYHIENVDFDLQTVTFREFQAEYTIRRSDDVIVWDQNAVKALRKHMSLTQAKFAQELGVRRQTVSEWENGVYEPDRSTAKHLERIAQQKGFDA